MPVTGLSYVTLTGTFINIRTALPSSGSVRLSFSGRWVNTSTDQIVTPGDFQATLDSNGQISLVIPATDDPDFLPVDRYWTVTEFIDGATRNYAILLPASPSSQDLANIAPIDPTDPAAVYTLVSSATPGVFDAGKYGVAGDGSTNDRAALQATIDAAVAYITPTQGAEVVLPAGTYYLSGTPATVPVNPGFGSFANVGLRLPVGLAARLVIRGKGRGVSTIKLSDTARGAFWIDQTMFNGTATTTSGSNVLTAVVAIGTRSTLANDQAIAGTGIPAGTTISSFTATTITMSANASASASLVAIGAWSYETFQNVTFEDFDVDNNNTIGRCQMLIGNMPGLITPTRYLSFRNVDVRRIRGYNCPAEADLTQTDKVLVRFIGKHSSTNETTQTSSKNILVEDVTLDGGSGLANVVSFVSQGSTNHYYDNITYLRCRHVVSTPSTVQLGQTSFFICGSGYGFRGEATDCYSENIGDDAFEMGSMEYLAMDRCRAKNPNQSLVDFRHTNNGGSFDPDRQIVTMRRCSVDNDATFNQITGAKGRPVAFISDSGQEFGEFDLEIAWTSDTLTRSKIGQNNWCYDITQPIRRLVLRPKVYARNFTWDVNSAADTTPFSLSSTKVGSVVEVIDPDIRMRGIIESTSTTWNLHAFFLNPTNGTVNVRGGQTEFTFPNTYSFVVGDVIGLGKVASTTLRGVMSKHTLVGPASIAAASWRAIRLSGTGTVASYLFEGNDFSVSAGTRLLATSSPGANLGNTAFRNNVLASTDVTTASATTTTLPPDGEYQLISGTTTITSVTASYRGRRVTLVFSGILTFTDGSNLKLAGDLTTAANTTISLVCDGTNWFETSRSVN